MVRSARPILPLAVARPACATTSGTVRCVPASPLQQRRGHRNIRTPTSRPAAAWRGGANPLSLGPDGFGQVLPTPAARRNRRLPTIDRLPPPPEDRFTAAVQR